MSVHRAAGHYGRFVAAIALVLLATNAAAQVAKTYRCVNPSGSDWVPGLVVQGTNNNVSQCLSYNGQDCQWRSNYPDCLAVLNSSTTIVPLVGGACVPGASGWPAVICAAFSEAASYKCVQPGGAGDWVPGLVVNNVAQCLSYNGRDCQWRTTQADCQAALNNLTPLVPLVAGSCTGATGWPAAVCAGFSRMNAWIRYKGPSSNPTMCAHIYGGSTSGSTGERVVTYNQCNVDWARWDYSEPLQQVRRGAYCWTTVVYGNTQGNDWDMYPQVEVWARPCANTRSQQFKWIPTGTPYEPKAGHIIHVPSGMCVQTGPYTTSPSNNNWLILRRPVAGDNGCLMNDPNHGWDMIGAVPPTGK